MAIKTQAPKTRRSKVEVQEQFDHLREALSTEKEERSAHEEAAALAREKQIRELTQGVTAETVIQRLNATGLDISKGLSELSSRLLEECRQLDTLKQAVALEQKELERLHGLDVSSASLAQLVEDYEAKKREFEADMTEARAHWTAEKEASEKERARDLEDFTYRTEQERQRQADEQAQVERVLERKNKEKQETLEKSWAERAVVEATKTLQANHTQAFVLAQKDMESDRRLAEMRVKSLEEAKRQVQNIAVKAIESASGSAALSHINQIAMEQAKTRSQS